MKILALENDLTITLPELAKMAKRGIIIVTRNGKPLVSVKDLSQADWAGIALANNSRFQALMEKSRQGYQRRGGKRIEDFRADLGLRDKSIKAKSKKK